MWIICSARFLTSAASFFFASSAACISASFFIFSISSGLRPELASILIDCSLPLDLSFAFTFRIPFASISKVTSTCGTPLGAGGIPSKINLPSDRLSLARGLSPWTTCISTLVWLSAAVEKTCDFEAGMVVFFSISLVFTPPIVSIPRERGITSSRSISFTSPAMMPPWIAAPKATTSSGLILLFGSLPKNFFTSSTIFGILVWPPTSTISSISPTLNGEASIALFVICIALSINSSAISSSFARVIFMSRCLGPEESEVMKGIFTSVSIAVESSIFAFSAASSSL